MCVVGGIFWVWLVYKEIKRLGASNDFFFVNVDFGEFLFFLEKINVFLVRYPLGGWDDICLIVRPTRPWVL